MDDVIVAVAVAVAGGVSVVVAMGSEGAADVFGVDTEDSGVGKVSVVVVMGSVGKTEVVGVVVIDMVSVAGVVDVGTEVSGVVLAGVLQLVKGRACGPPAWKQISSPEPSALKL